MTVFFKKKDKRRGGFSILELIVVLGILSLVVTLLIGALAEFRTTSALAEAKSEIIGMLRDARARTLASRNNINYGVHFEETAVVLFEGGIYNASVLSNEIYKPRYSRVSAINLGGTPDIIFERLSGAALANGTIILEATRDISKTETITILATGVVQ